MPLCQAQSAVCTSRVAAFQRHCNLTDRRYLLRATLLLLLALLLPIALRSPHPIKALEATKKHVVEFVQQRNDRHAAVVHTVAQLIASSATQSTSSKDTTQQLESKAEDDGEDADEQKEEIVEMCPICLAESCDALVQPCCHISCCFECGKVLKKSKKACPRCHIKIRSVVAIKR